jgi:hypothetical protein
MNDRSNQTLRRTHSLSLAAIWLALLAKTARPLWTTDPPAEIFLLVEPSGTVRRGPGPCPHGEVIQGILLEYATTLGIPMSFRAAANRYSRPVSADAVHVHAFALPTPPVLFGKWPRVPLVALPMAYGIPLREGFHFSLSAGTQVGRGRLLLDGDGRAVGEYAGTNLYSFFDLLSQEAAWVPILLRRHLDAGLPLLLPALRRDGVACGQASDARLLQLRENTEEIVRMQRMTLREGARAAYVSACQERVAEEIRFLLTEIAFLEDGVEEMARRISADTRRLNEGRRRRGILQGGQDPQESGGREVESLQSLSGVREARVQDGRISVTTIPLVVEHGDRRYRLGSFQVDLYFNGDVRITNLTHRVGPYDHPHVHHGRPCLGSVREGIAKLLGEYQFVAATEVLIDLLLTVDPAEWRLPVTQWPEAEPEACGGALEAA